MILCGWVNEAYNKKQFECSVGVEKQKCQSIYRYLYLVGLFLVSNNNRDQNLAIADKYS